MRVSCGSRWGRCVLFINILDSLTAPCLVYNTAMYTVYGRYGKYGRCMVYTDPYSSHRQEEAACLLAAVIVDGHAKCSYLLNNSQIHQLADCQLADWTSRRLVNLQTRQFMDWLSRELDNSQMPLVTSLAYCLVFVFWPFIDVFLRVCT